MTEYMNIGQVTQALTLSQPLPYEQITNIRPYWGGGFPNDMLIIEHPYGDRALQVVKTDRQSSRVKDVLREDGYDFGLSKSRGISKDDFKDKQGNIDVGAHWGAFRKAAQEYRQSEEWKELEAGIPVAKLLLANGVVEAARAEIDGFDRTYGDLPSYYFSNRSLPYSGDHSFVVVARNKTLGTAVALNPRQLGDFNGLDEVIREAVNAQKE